MHSLETPSDSAPSLIRIAPTSLVPDPAHTTRTGDPAALQSLADSIATFGLLQPVVATKTGQGLMVVAGERRRQAAISAGLGEIDVLVIDSAAAEISLIENVQRRDLDPIDEAEAMERLRQIENYTHEELAWLTGRKRSSISELLTLARLPSSIKAACRNSALPKSLLIEVAKQSTVAEMEALLAGFRSGTPTTNPRPYNRRRHPAARQSTPDRSLPDATVARVNAPLLGDSAEGSPWLHVPRPAGFWVDESVWRLCLRNLVRSEPTLLYGPTGCGKTDLVYHLAAAAGRTVYTVNMGATTDARLALVGTTHYDGRRTVFHPSAIVKGIQDPTGLILLDEITRSGADAGHILFPLLDHQRMLAVDESDPPTLIRAHPNAGFFATANVGVEYTGTRDLDRALRDRFLVVDLDYPPEDAEADTLVAKSGVARPLSRRLVAVATECRKAWRQETLSTPVSTRDVIKAAGLIVDGFDPMRALEAAVVSLFDDSGGAASERTIVRQIIQKF